MYKYHDSSSSTTMSITWNGTQSVYKFNNTGSIVGFTLYLDKKKLVHEKSDATLD